MLQSVRLTERVKIWDKFSGNINQQSVKIGFLKKTHRQNPPFKFKVKHPRRATIKVLKGKLFLDLFFVTSSVMHYRLFNKVRLWWLYIFHFLWLLKIYSTKKAYLYLLIIFYSN